MKRWLSGVSLTLMASILLLISYAATPSHAATLTPVGLSQAVCLLGIEGDGTYFFHNLIVTVTNDNGSSADVTISTQQGKSSSTYHVSYTDSEVITNSTAVT